MESNTKWLQMAISAPLQGKLQEFLKLTSEGLLSAIQGQPLAK